MIRYFNMNIRMAIVYVGVLLLTTFFLSYLLCACVRLIANKLQLISHPSEDRFSSRHVPLGGGLGWVGALLLTIALGTWWMMTAELPEAFAIHRGGMESKLSSLAWICSGAAVLMLMGLCDDMKPVPVWMKLLIEFAIAITLAFQVPDVLITAFVDHLELNRIFTVLWIVFFINSINLLDHADGISSVTGIAIFMGLVALSAISGQLFVGLFSVLMVGVLMGFLSHNFPPARLFMGDAGSLPLGYFVGVITALFTFYSSHRDFSTLFVPLGLLLVPVYDSMSVILIRFKEKRPLFKGDKSHVSHRLIKKGWSHRRIVLTLFALSLLGASLSAMLFVVTAPLSYLAIALMFVLMMVMYRLETVS